MMATAIDDQPTCHVVRLNPHRWNGRTIVMTHGAWHSSRHYHLVAVAPAEPAELADRPDSWEDLGDRIRTVYGGVPWEFPKTGWTHGTPAFVAACIGTGARFPPVDHETYLATLSPLRAELSAERLREVLAPPARSVDFAGGKVLVRSSIHYGLCR